MITNTGKSIIARYLLGQTSDYASYIAVGCGPKPLDTTDSFGDYSTQESLDFEMFRVPIISRGTVTDEGVTKIVLSAELPTENRYEISEVGVFSAGSNPALGAYSSRSIFTFTDSEAWLYGSSTPPLIIDDLDDGEGGFDSSVIEENNAALSAFYANSDNSIFNSGGRKEKYETPRFMNTSLLIPGNASSMTNTSGVLGTPSGTALKLNGTDLNIDRYSPEDEIRIAFSVVDKPINSSQLDLGSVRIKIEFRYSSEETSPKAEFDAVIQDSAGLEDSRYFVSSKAIKDMTYSTTDFSWASVSVVHIYVAAYSTESNTISSSSSSDFYVALDGLRIENAQTNNPLYGMVGYSVLKNKDAETIIKKNNSTSYIEFRYVLDVN
jgi:hypothetical protein